MLCKYSGQEAYYFATLAFFVGNDSELLKRPSSDEVYEILEKMLAQSFQAKAALALVSVPDSIAVPSYPTLGKYVFKFGLALISQRVAPQICYSFHWGTIASEVCLKFGDGPMLSALMNLVKKEQFARYRSSIEIALREGEEAPCVNEE